MPWRAPSAEQTDRDLAAIDKQGFVVIESLLTPDELSEIRSRLEAFLSADLHGRNDFEGHRTQRVYALVSRGRIFEDLVRHPRILAICERTLLPNHLLTASQAICIHPGETPQPLHYDDTFYWLPRPRPPVSMSTIWAVDAFTEDNGGTQVIPGSHLWSDEEVTNLFESIDFTTRKEGRPHDSAERPTDQALADRLHTLTMPPGSVVVFSGTLVHRGGGNAGPGSRLAFSNQYCQPWARQQENFTLGIAPEKVMAMDERVRQLLGFSIHPPFMGHYGGLHPIRVVDPDGPKPQ